MGKVLAYSVVKERLVLAAWAAVAAENGQLQGYCNIATNNLQYN
jgi:hypothetical protein